MADLCQYRLHCACHLIHYDVDPKCFHPSDYKQPSSTHWLQPGWHLDQLRGPVSLRLLWPFSFQNHETASCQMHAWLTLLRGARLLSGWYASSFSAHHDLLRSSRSGRRCRGADSDLAAPRGRVVGSHQGLLTYGVAHILLGPVPLCVIIVWAFKCLIPRDWLVDG